MRARRVLAWVLAIVLLLAVAVLAAAWAYYATARTSTVGKLDFVNKLKIPPILEPRTDARGRKVFNLELRTGKSEFRPGRTVETWGVNGTYLGPTLRASLGDRVQMRVRSGLPETTTIHWHGMHLPAKSDGNLHQPIATGAVWSPAWTIDQPAATLWYHPDAHRGTDDQMYRGIAGMFILDDPLARRLALPKTYGVDDIPVIIQDKNLGGDELDFGKRMISPTGFLGDDILVNGTYDPRLDVTTELVRLRLLNASNARIYNIGLSDDRPFDLVATDGGLLAAPVRISRIKLSPAERVEVVIALRPGEAVVLRSYEPDLGTNFWEGRFAGGDDTFDLLQLRAARRLESSAPLPRQLVPVERLQADSVIAKRSFELNGQSSINDREFDIERTDVTAIVETAEFWEVRNGSGTPHNFHVHGVQFQVVNYAGLPPPNYLAGWKDTVYIPPHKSVGFLVRFSDYSDSSTPYMLHCHLTQHQDRGMMAQLAVVEP